MPEIPKRTLITLMNALSSGVVPRRGLEYIAVGRRRETETFVSDLDDTSAGGGAFRFVSGRYGNGKSFMIQMIRNYAMNQGFVVMDADLSINRRLTGSKKEGLNTYRELVRNMAIKSRPDGGALESVLQRWIDASEGDVPTMRSGLSSLGHLTYSQDFSTVLLRYADDTKAGDADMPALRWLKGEYESRSDVRGDLHVHSLIGDANWYDHLKLWAEFSRIAGFRGLVVFLDEAVVLYKLPSKASRSNNYERLLTIFNDIMQGKSSYMSMYVCGTPEFIEDPRRGLYSYEALRSRLTAGRYESGYDNYLGPVINLRPLTPEEIYVLLKRIRDLHSQRHGYAAGVTDSMLEEYLRTVLANTVSPDMLTPREITRDLISLLDTLHQNPDADFVRMIGGRKVDPDIDPDDVIEGLEV